MKIADVTEFGIPVTAVATGLIASRVLPSTLKLESTYMKAGLNAALGIGALFLSHKRDGASGDFLHFAGLGLLSMGLLEVVKNFLPLTAQAGIAGVSAYPTYGYQALSAYPSEVATPALSDGMGMDGVGDNYPYYSEASY